MKIIQLQQNDWKTLFHLYTSIFLDSADFNKFLFHHFDSYKNCYVFKDKNKIISCIFVTDFVLNNNDKVTKKFLFIYGLFTIPEYRNMGYSKKMLNYVKKRFGKNYQDIILQPINIKYYKWANIKSMIKIDVCYNTNFTLNNVINFKNNNIWRENQSENLLSIYNKYHRKKLNANKNYCFQVRTKKYYEDYFNAMKSISELKCLSTDKSYILYDECDKTVKEFFSLCEYETKFIIDLFNNYKFWLINQNEYKRFFINSEKKNKIYSINFDYNSLNYYMFDIFVIE